MSWLLDLYHTYQNNQALVGEPQQDHFGNEYTLLPESHSYQVANIEVVITSAGDFYSAQVLPNKGGNTLIPTTIDSASRSGKNPPPHPLQDKLQYVAGDLAEYSQEPERMKMFNDAYMTNLRAWCESDFSNDRVNSIYTYLKKKSLVADLIAHKILFVMDGQLLPKWNRDLTDKYGEKPAIFASLGAVEQTSAFVRFTVHDPGDSVPDVWADKNVYQSFIDYYHQQLPNIGLDYVTGEEMPLTDKHPAKIRYGGDMAKLISGNDTQGYTFRGRFATKDQVATIGYDVSDKGHKALRWLITKQGRNFDGRVFLAWSGAEVTVPQPEDSSLSIFELSDDNLAEADTTDVTNANFAEQFNKALSGYLPKDNLKTQDRVYIMVLDSATPGRMDITYYQTLDKEQYLNRLRQWHTSMVWYLNYGKEKRFWGAPGLRDIADAAFGSRAKSQLLNTSISRLLKCVVDNAPLPRDLIQQLYWQASRPLTMERWEWEKTISIACSVLRRYYKEEQFTMAIDKEQTDRSFLYGRLLAVADVLESGVLRTENSNRATNALRYMNAFSQRPLSTWKIIEQNLQPYISKLTPQLRTYYQSYFDEINDKLQTTMTDDALDGKYLIGYHSQRFDLYQKKSEDDD